MNAKSKKTRRKAYRPVPPTRPQARADGRSKRVMVDPAEAERRAAEARRQWVRYERVRRIGWALVAMAALIAVVHWVDHADLLHLLNEQVEELVIGWPAAGITALVGAICLGQLNPAERKRKAA